MSASAIGSAIGLSWLALLLLAGLTAAWPALAPLYATRRRGAGS